MKLEPRSRTTANFAAQAPGSVRLHSHAQGLGNTGALMVGIVATVTQKLQRLQEVTGFGRLQALADWGGLPEHQVLDSITQLGQDIARRLRERVDSAEPLALTSLTSPA